MKSAQQNSLSDTKGFPHRPPPLLLPRQPSELPKSPKFSPSFPAHQASRGRPFTPRAQHRAWLSREAFYKCHGGTKFKCTQRCCNQWLVGSLAGLANMGVVDEGSCWLTSLVTVGKQTQNRSLSVLRCTPTSRSSTFTGSEFCPCPLFMILNLSRHNGNV